MEHPSYVVPSDEEKTTQNVAQFPKKSFSIMPPGGETTGTNVCCINQNYILETHKKNTKFKLTPLISSNKSIRKSTTISIVDNSYSTAKQSKKAVQTIKQIYDQEIFYDFDKVMQHANMNTIYNLNKKKIFIVSVILVILLALNIIIAIIENLIYLKKTKEALNKYGICKINFVKQRKITLVENLLRIINIYLSIIGAVFILVLYLLRIEILKGDGYISKSDNLFTVNLWKSCFIKILFALIANPPFVNGLFIIGNVSGKCTIISLNSIICTLVLFKICFTIVLLRRFSYYSDDISKSICGDFQVSHSILFSVKSFLNKHYILIPTSIFIYTLMSSSIILLNFESGKYENGVLKSNVDNLLNAIWLSFSIITTLSVGDYYPVTFIGNLLSIIFGILGLYSITLIIFAFGDFSHFSFNEMKSYVKLKKISSGENKEAKAATAIQLLLRIRRNIIIYRKRKGQDLNTTDISVSNNSGSDAQLHRYDCLLSLFGMFCLFKVSLLHFKNEYKIARNLGIPVDEYITNINNNHIMNVEVAIQLMDKFKYITNDLDELLKNQYEIEKSMQGVEQMQKKLERYLINLNNTQVLDRKKEKKLKNKKKYEMLIRSDDDDKQ